MLAHCIPIIHKNKAGSFPILDDRRNTKYSLIVCGELERSGSVGEVFASSDFLTCPRLQ